LPNDKLPLKYWFDVPNVIAFYLLLKVEKSVFDNKPVLTLLDKVVEALLLKVFQSVEVNIPLVVELAFDKAFYLLLNVIKFVFVKYPFYDILAGWLILFNCAFVRW